MERFLKLIESKRANLKIDKTDIDEMTFETEHIVKGKKGRIDIFGKSKSLVLVIENKIKADETKTNGIPQSDIYYKYCEKNYKDKQRCYILLKRLPYTSLENKNFIPITYQELFDEVIKPAYENCRESEDTKRVLEHYALDISNPFIDITLATTQKDISAKIYEKHAMIIEKIRVAEEETDRDEDSDICNFFDENEKYINNIILKSLGKNIIRPRKAKLEELKKLRGKKLLDMLLEYDYIIPYQTELIYKFMSATCIIMVDENRKFYGGYYKGDDYDGSQKVDIIAGGFVRLRDAELAVEKELNSKSSNGGKSAYELMLLKSKIKEAEGNKIGDILKQL